MATALNRVVRHLADVSDQDAPPRRAPEALTSATADLLSRIVRVQRRGAPFDALSAEVLPVLLDVFDARAGALLVLQREEGSLALATARGLSAAGAGLLEGLRWGDPNGWDMPLQALRDRRVYLIDRPEEHPFVPELVARVEGREIPNVVAIPLYCWHAPLGVVLVVAGRRPIGEEEILANLVAYELLALALTACPTDEAPGLAGDRPPLACAQWIDPRETARQPASEQPPPPPGSDERDTIETLLRELRATVDAMQAERHAAAAERGILAEQLSATERERTELLARIAALEARPVTSGSPSSVAGAAVTVTPAAGVPCDDGAAPAAMPAPPTAPSPPLGEPVMSAAATAATVADPPVAAAAPEGAAPAEPGQLRVADDDPARRESLTAALTTALPAARRAGLVVANLFEASPETLAELTATSSARTNCIAYAADAQGRSHVLGPVRCFTAPPTAAETTAVFEARAVKRVITLSGDTDAFGPAKAALAKIGCSVAMACDEKQAVDLIAIVRPDAVLVDLRSAPEAAAEFLDALAPESGRVLTLLVVGDPAARAASRALGRLLQPKPLDVAELVKLCRRWLAADVRPA